MNKNIYPLIFALLALAFYILSRLSFSNLDGRLLVAVYSVLLLIGGVTTVKYFQHRKKVKAASSDVARLSLSLIIGIVAIIASIILAAIYMV